MATMPDYLFQMLSTAFIQRAFIVGILAALLSSLLSVFVVLKRVSLLGDGLAHSSFGGLALGFYLGIPPLWIAGIVSVLAAIGITKSQRTKKIAGDAAVALFLVLGLASGIVLISLAHGYGFNIESLLFGSILLVTTDQIFETFGMLIISIALISLFFKELVLITFDETQARAAGVSTSFFDYLFSVLAGVTVVVSIPVVGVLLIAALLVLPGLASLQVTRSFRQSIFLSMIFGVSSVILGLLGSIIIDTASGATIVLASLGIFLVTVAANTVKRAITGSRTTSSSLPNGKL
jgi:zinc transport system permease protein